MREKLIEKIPKLICPSYLMDKYAFALLFHTPKFPPLPYSELPLAFWPHSPRWFICGSHLKFLENECKKLVERVVVTKYDLHSYQCHHMSILRMFEFYLLNKQVMKVKKLWGLTYLFSLLCFSNITIVELLYSCCFEESHEGCCWFSCCCLKEKN